MVAFKKKCDILINRRISLEIYERQRKGVAGVTW